MILPNIQDKLNNLEIVKGTEKVNHDYQFYGLEIAKKLKLDQFNKTRVMGFLKRGNDGHRLLDLAQQLASKELFKSITPKAQVSYLIGAYKKSL